MNYARNRKAFEYLGTLAELNDQMDLDARREELMRNPTKLLAAVLYEMAIRLWFQEHDGYYDHEPKVRAIRSTFEA